MPWSGMGEGGLSAIREALVELGGSRHERYKEFLGGARGRGLSVIMDALVGHGGRA